MWATTALSVSEFVTAANPSASLIPARSSISSTSTSPSMVLPRNSEDSPLRASRLLSITTTLCPFLYRRKASSEPTRPHPITKKFINFLLRKTADHSGYLVRDISHNHARFGEQLAA